MFDVVNNNWLFGTSRHEDLDGFVVIAVGSLVERARRAILLTVDSHTRRCVGLTLIHLRVSAATHLPTTRRQGNEIAWGGPSFSITIISRSLVYGVVDIGFQSI